MRRLTLLAAVVTLVLAPAATATVLLALALDDLVEQAPVVVVGEVNRIDSGFNATRTKIYTRVQISVGEVLRGRDLGGTLTIKMLGGQVGDIVAHMPGAPRFEAGERVLLFLEPRKDGDGYLTVGMYQGKYRVFRDPDTREEFVLRDGPEPGVRLVGEDTLAEGVHALGDVRKLVSRPGGGR